MCSRYTHRTKKFREEPRQSWSSLHRAGAVCVQYLNTVQFLRTLWSGIPCSFLSVVSTLQVCEFFPPFLFLCTTITECVLLTCGCQPPLLPSFSVTEISPVLQILDVAGAVSSLATPGNFGAICAALHPKL